MDTYPHWGQLTPADSLRLAALEAELAKVRPAFVEAICRAADLLERLATGQEPRPDRDEVPRTDEKESRRKSQKEPRRKPQRESRRRPGRKSER